MTMKSMNGIFAILTSLALLGSHTSVSPALAADEKLSKQQLDQLLAPIALYQDDLLTNVLMAATYPLDIVEANRWVKEPENAKLKGDELAKALEDQTWDPSVKAIVQFPKVLDTMSSKLDWTKKVGGAFVAQQDQVMDEIQFLRSKADASGSLKSDKEQKVSKQSGSSGSAIVIEPADPDTVYVPVYDPNVVYGDWWYPDYPPYVWTYPGVSYVDGWWWGAGVVVAGSIWGWSRWDWRHHRVHVDANKWNRINNHRTHMTSDRWRHDAGHARKATSMDRARMEKRFKADKAAGSKKVINANRARSAKAGKNLGAHRHFKRPGRAGHAAHINRRRATHHHMSRPAMRRHFGGRRGGFRRRR